MRKRSKYACFYRYAGYRQITACLFNDARTLSSIEDLGSTILLAAMNNSIIQQIWQQIRETPYETTQTDLQEMIRGLKERERKAIIALQPKEGDTGIELWYDPEGLNNFLNLKETSVRDQ